MSAISKWLPVPPDNFSTQIASPTVSTSALSIDLDDASGLDTEGVGVLFKKNADGTITAGTIEFIHWTNKSGNTITLTDTGDRGLTGSDSGAQAYVADDYFEVWVTSYYYSSGRGGFLVGHDQDGGHNLATGANIQVNSADPTRALYVPAQGMFAANTSGAASAQLESSTNKVNTKVFDFDKDADEYVHFGLQMPLLWDAGTVTAQFIWTTAGTTGDVIWGMQGVALANDDPLDTAYGTAQTATDTFLLANDVHISSATSAITIAGSPTAGEWVQFRIYRDADAGGDTLDADAKLIGVRIAWKMTKYNDA